MYPASIQKLISLFSKFPTVGPRTAARFVFYLLKLKKEEVQELISAISTLKEKVKYCSFCFKPFEPARAGGGEKELCEICSNAKRDKSLLCVVEKETDLETIEKTKKYQGRYFILGGTVSKLKKENSGNIRKEEFLERVNDPEVKEVILALNPTSEGEATTLYLERLLKPFDAARGKKITRLGRGLPVGAELEYADEETLSSALEGRK
ncbi:MAG: recombination protein RecR [Candidatus Nealsonbacteria bacterium]|nr:MAG: recombination protein RecR [Candidatus Nealsonbacteria bacterium]